MIAKGGLCTLQGVTSENFAYECAACVVFKGRGDSEPEDGKLW